MGEDGAGWRLRKAGMTEGNKRGGGEDDGHREGSAEGTEAKRRAAFHVKILTTQSVTACSLYVCTWVGVFVCCVGYVHVGWDEKAPSHTSLFPFFLQSEVCLTPHDKLPGEESKHRSLLVKLQIS